MIEEAHQRHINRLQKDASARAPDAPPRPRSKSLTPREQQMLNLIAEGWSNKEIGAELRIHPETVKSHLARLYPKLRANSRAHAVHRAWLTGWFSMPSLEARSRRPGASSPLPSGDEQKP